jgi:hypothetical protein
MPEHLDIRLSRDEYEAVFGALVLASVAAEPFRRGEAPTLSPDEQASFENAMANAIHGVLNMPQMACLSLVMRLSRDGVAAFGKRASHAEVDGFAGRAATVPS